MADNPFDKVTIPGQPAAVAAPEADNPFAKVTVVPLPPEASWADTFKGIAAGAVLPPVTLLNNIAAKPLENYLTPGTDDHAASIRLQQYLEDVGSPGGRTTGRIGGEIAAALGLTRLGVPPPITGGILGASQPADSLNQLLWQTLGGAAGGGLGNAFPKGLLDYMAGSRGPPGLPGIAGAVSVGGAINQFAPAIWNAIKSNPDMAAFTVPGLAAGYGLYQAAKSPTGQKVLRGLLPFASGLGAEGGATVAGRAADDQTLPDMTGLLPWMASGF